MSRFKFFLSLIFGLLLASSCAAATIGTPAALASGSSVVSATTLAIGTGANSSSAGASIIVAAGMTSGGATTIDSVADDNGNTYVGGSTFNQGSSRIRFFWCFRCIALGISKNITITYSAANTNPKLAAAVSISNLAVLAVDQQNGTANVGGGGTGVVPTLTTGTLAQPASIVFGGIAINLGSGDAFTEASGFNSLTSSANGGQLHWGYKIVAANTAVTYTPVLGTSRAWSSMYIVFEAAGSCFRTTMGAGC
jgi:hypothetical protein